MAQPGSPQDQQLQYWFGAIDQDRSGFLTADELGRALVNGNWQPFNPETVRLLLNLFDQDRSGTITFPEFTALWRYIESWKGCFQQFDRDGSGTIDRVEMRTALSTFGFNVSEQIVDIAIRKFDRRGQSVTFDNFIQICVTVRTITDGFRRFDTDNDGWIQINYNQFMELAFSSR